MTHFTKKTLFTWAEFIPKSFLCFKEGYTALIFKKDLVAGLTVGIVAVPLALAFAIASGVSPERGLFTAIIAGFIISLLGGSRVQIGGPTGAFVVIVYDIVQRQGYSGLVVATFIAAIILILMGVFRLGSWIKFIPYPLIIGFTTGIAVIIFSSQVKDFFGLTIQNMPANFLPKWEACLSAMPTLDPMTFGVAGGSLALIICIRRFIPVIPWGVAAIAIATCVCAAFDLPVATIASRYGGIPSALPFPSLPELNLSLESFRSLIPDAITIAFLAAIESLLSAVIADGMMGGRHRPNCELIAQGLANMGSIFFGGIPATGAIARTATNIKTGAQTPVAGMIHAIVLVLFIVILAPLVGKIPLPALSAVLIMVAWNMSEVQHFLHVFKAPLGDLTVMLTAFFLTVLVDITVAVEVGLILSAFLFMKRMSDFSGVISLTRLFKEKEGKEGDDPDAISKKKVPVGVEVYEINGPLFFGIADSLKDVLQNIEFPPKVFILRMRKVPVIDASGMNALDDFYLKCKKRGTVLLLSGVGGQPAKSLQKYGLETRIGKENIFPHIDAALQRTQELLFKK